MSRTSTTVGRRQSIPAWMTAAAVVAVLALALVWRAAPAMADTAPAATPTVAPTTAAAVATATPVASNSVQTRAVAPGTGDQCATPDASFGGVCVLELKLVPTATPAGDLGWRVGDTFKVDVVVLNHSATDQKINVLAASMDFNTAELQLVNASSAPVAQSDGQAAGTIVSLNDTITTNPGYTLFVNDYIETTASSVTTGKIDLEFGVTNLANAFTIAAKAGSTPGNLAIGSFYVRVKSNPASNTTYTITLRDQNESTSGSNRYRNSIIGDGSSATTAGKNIMGAATDASLTIKKTTVDLSLAVGTPVARGVARIGDTVPVALQVSNSANMFVRNATSIDAAVTFDITKFTLVTANVSGDDSKVSVLADADDATVADITGATSDAFASATSQTGGRKYTVSGNTGTVTLKLDSATALGFTGSAATKTVATIYLRPRYNSSSQNVTISGGSIIGIRNGASMGFQLNVTATTSTASVAVATTTVGLTMAPTLPGTIRVGDAIPVDIKITPTDARYVNRIKTQVTFDKRLFQVVQDGTTSYTPVSVDTGAPVSLSGSTLTSAQATTNTLTVAGNTATITLDLDGGFVPEGTSPVLVGTFYVRPLQKTASNHEIRFSGTVASQAGEKRATNATPALDFEVAVTPATSASDGTQLADPAIGPVLGTLGVSLEMRSPTVANPTLAADTVTWTASSSSLDVVDGRFLDVKVIVDAKSLVGDARKVDHLSIVLAFDASQLQLGDGTSAVANTDYKLGTDITAGTVAVASTSVTLPLTYTPSSSAFLSASTEVARLRFKLLTPATPASATVDLKVADSTVLKQSTGLFVTDNYADPVGAGPRGEFDASPTATRQKPATLQISALLQGRTAQNDPSRFVQNFAIELRASGAAKARHLTVAPAVSVSGCTASCDPDMKFVKASKQVSSSANAQFAASNANNAAASPLSDLEPGTYDVYVKGRSSVAVLVKDVVFGAGADKTITNLVMAEGDLDGNDQVKTADFTAFSSAYRTEVAAFLGYTSGTTLNVTRVLRGNLAVGQSLGDDAALAGITINAAGSVDSNGVGTYTLSAAPTSDVGTSTAPVVLWASNNQTSRVADMNQSGYVDILDFSLLGYNYDVVGPTDAVSGTTNLGLGSGNLVTVNRVGARSSNPTASLDVAVGPRDSDGIAAVSVAVAPGSRAVDGVQVNLKTAPGVQVVDAPSGGTFAPAEANPMPIVLQQAWDAARGLINLGLGRAPSASGLTDPTTLGTIFVKIPAGFTGSPISIERTDGLFPTTVASAGTDVTGALNVTVDGTTVSVDSGTVVVDQPAAGSVVIGGSDPVVVASPPARVPASSGGAPALTAPVASAAPVQASSPAVAPASAPASAARPSTTAPTRSPFAPVMIENRIKGTLTLVRPGTGTVELKTGLATTTPDAFCPVARHKTYIRLEDTGIAGATFGVEAGGVISWVTPDQAGCVNWNAISEGGLTFTKETIMQFQLAQAVPGALLWVLDGNRNGELYEVDAQGVANYVTADAFAANQDHFTEVWANVIPVSTSQIEGLSARGSVHR